jgi:hypothetical protein
MNIQRPPPTCGDLAAASGFWSKSVNNYDTHAMNPGLSGRASPDNRQASSDTGGSDRFNY